MHPAYTFNRTINDCDYINLQNCDNIKSSGYVLSNYRNDIYYNQNPLYRYQYPGLSTQYDLQGINEGKGAGMNPSIDSSLIHGNYVTKPPDKLNESSKNMELHFGLYPCVSDNIQFLMSIGTPRILPQSGYNPYFNIAGVNTRHHGRLPDGYFSRY